MTTTTTGEQLAAIAEQLDQLDGLGADTPIHDAIADALRGRTWTLPRGVTLTTRDDGGVIYCESKTRREWSSQAEIRDRMELTVYGTVARPGKEEVRGQVMILHSFAEHLANNEPTRAYWTSLVGGTVPDGARANIAAAVLADVAECLTPAGWHTLADEIEHAGRVATIRNHLGTARREIDDARAKLARLD